MREVLRNRRYALYLVSRVSRTIATQMLSVAVGWQVYEITGQALALGFSGLALFLPGFILALPGGHVADRVDRRRILLFCHLGVTLSAVALALLARSGTRSLLPIYAVLVVLGTIRAFSGPADQALMPNLIGRENLERAIALGSSSSQLAMIAGPSLGGVIYAATRQASAVYTVCSALALIAFVSVFAIGHVVPPADAKEKEPPSLDTLFAGIRYVWSNKPILGAISLDLFAVLLGGAVALLPIFAKDLLAVGPWGFGLLRSAPAIGAATVAIILANRPIKGNAGRKMFACVFLFGVATVVFGASRSFPVSLAALLVLGAADLVRVVIRTPPIQVRTPDQLPRPAALEDEEIIRKMVVGR